MNTDPAASSPTSPVLVALATYNEIENLPSLVEAIHAQELEVHVLVVDDNSPDGTGAWCAEKANTTPWFFHHPRTGKLGLGSALATALKHGVEHGYSKVITMDADWSHPPDRLPALIETSESADVVIGSRYCPGGSVVGWPRRRKALSWLMNFMTRTLIGLPLTDCSNNFRLYRTELLRQLEGQELRCTGYAYLEEILWHLQRLGARFAEVPIVFTDRRAGDSKINFGEMLGAASTLLRLAVKRVF